MVLCFQPWHRFMHQWGGEISFAFLLGGSSSLVFNSGIVCGGVSCLVMWLEWSCKWDSRPQFCVLHLVLEEIEV